MLLLIFVAFYFCNLLSPFVVVVAAAGKRLFYSHNSLAYAARLIEVVHIFASFNIYTDRRLTNVYKKNINDFNYFPQTIFYVILLYSCVVFFKVLRGRDAWLLSSLFSLQIIYINNESHLNIYQTILFFRLLHTFNFFL